MPDRDLDAVKFQYDGKFVANRKITGTWERLDQVAMMDAFIPGKTVTPVADEKKKPNKRKIALEPLSEIAFNDGGQTSDRWRVWSGDLLMDLERLEALKIVIRAIGGNDYLFVETGGFDPEKGMDWKSPWLVFGRK